MPTTILPSSMAAMDTCFGLIRPHQDGITNIPDWCFRQPIKWQPHITNGVRESPPPGKLAILSSQTHKTHLLAPQILHNRCFRFLLRYEDVPREIENNASAKFWGLNRCIMGFVKVENATLMRPNKAETAFHGCQ